MSGSIATSAPGKSRPTTFRSGPIWILSRPEVRSAATRKPAESVLAALHPVLKHLQRHGAVVVRGLGDGAVIAFLDPGLVRQGAVAGQRQPHQSAGALRRQPVAI